MQVQSIKMFGILSMLLLLVTGCGSLQIGASGSLDAYCLWSEGAMVEHAESVAVTTDDRVAITALPVFDHYDIACPPEKSPTE